MVPFARLAPSMRSFTILTTLAACVLLLALPTGTAWANAADDRILTDCADSPNGALRGTYPPEQLRHALRNMPGDFREYTGCSDAIRQALLASVVRGGGNGTDGSGTGGIGGTGGTSGGAGAPGAAPGATGEVPSAPPPPGADRPVDVAGIRIAPGTLPEIGRDAHRLPTSLVVLLALLGVAALAPAALTIGRRVLDHRGA